MAQVKWIKIVTDIFDDEKILMIESLPKADSIIVIWFKLLCLAGKQNNSGVFVMGNGMPYTESMLAAIFKRKESTVKLALKTFEKFGMIEIVNDAVTIPNWDKHQTLDSYEKKKERDRLYQAERRKRQKRLTKSSADTSDKSSDKSSDTSPDWSSDVAVSDIEEDIDIDKEEDKEERYKEESTDAERPAPRPNVPYAEIQAAYNELCPSLARCKTLSEARKKAIRARMTAGYTLEDFKTVFAMAESSAFLKGANNRDWRADFEWLIRDANMAKVLDGKYEDRRPPHGSEKSSNPFLDMLKSEGGNV